MNDTHDSNDTHERAGPTRRARASTGARSGRGDLEARLLSWTGFAATLFGLGLSFGPRLSWKAAKIATALSELGVLGGSVVMGGLVLAGLGMLRRAQGAPRAQTEEDDDLLLEQIATDSVRMSSALEAAAGTGAALEDEVREMRGEIAMLAQACAADPSADGSAQDAIFRLAATLDQVGARIEERLKAQHGSIQDSLEEVTTAVIAASRDLRELLESAPLREAGTGSTPPGEPAPDPLPADPIPPDSLLMGDGDAEAPAQEWIAGEPPVPTWSEELPPAGDGPSLGLLDTLDDAYVAAAPPVEETDGEPPAPAPMPLSRGTSWEEELQLVDTPVRPALAAGDEATQRRLAELGELLADEKVRSLLESMRRD